ncbi:MAG: hypothetical protein M1133_05985 [Armatimonadetes bacterium]|nr:hypothetical protein [Armatimonadota bacterium]
MNTFDIEARAFLKEFQQQPEEIRRVFLYVICQTMVQTGLLELTGVSKTLGLGVTLVYRKLDTGEMFDIVKPEMSKDEEQAIGARIGELLRESARAA